MKPSLRVVSLLVAALSFTLPASAVCIMQQSNAPTIERLTDVHPGSAVGDDLNEYAVLFNDIRNQCGPGDDLIKAFQKKLENQHAGGGFTGFLSGGIVSLAYSTAMVIGNQGKLDDYPEIDRLLGEMRWASDLRGGCGFANGRWREGNTCFEELAVTAQGHAWRGAYFKYSRRERRAEGDRREAVRRINESLLDTDDSICIHDPNRSVDGSKGPCNATIDELRVSLRNNGQVGIVPINHEQENAAYGVGIVTTLAHAFVGLEAMGEPMTAADYHDLADVRTVMEGLAIHGQRTVSDLGGRQWVNACFGPDPVDRRFISIERRDQSCRDPIGYLLAMYPVARFYERNGFSLGNLDPSKYDYQNRFPTELFKTGSNFIIYDQFGFGRYEVYYTFTWEWWNNPASRPDFRFSYTPPACEPPDPAILVPLGVYSMQKNVQVSIPPQAAGTDIFWDAFNVVGGYQSFGGVESADESFTTFTFDVPCEAAPTPPVGNLIVQVRVTHCGVTRTDNITIPVNKPAALMLPAAGIIPGETARIPVHINSAPGDVVLTWENNDTTTVTIPEDAERPFIYIREVTPTVDDTRYSVKNISLEGCEGIASGEAIVNIFSAAGVLTVDAVTTNPGIITTFGATLKKATGEPIANAEVEFTVLGNVIGTAITDANGRATVTSVVESGIGVFNNAIRATYAGTDEIRGATGSARLVVRCDAVTVTPTAYNVTKDGAERLPIVVTTSEHCTWKPESDSSWIHILDAPDPRSGPGTFHIKIDPSDGTRRTGKVKIGLREIPITQAEHCSYQFVPDIAYIPSRGGLTGLDISAPAGCEWTLTRGATWITFRNDLSQEVPVLRGSGSKRIFFFAGENDSPNAKRTTEIRLREGTSETGETADVANINQSAPPPETRPVVVQGIDGGAVENGQNVSMRFVVEGGPVTYTWEADGRVIQQGTDSAANLTVSGGGAYPGKNESITYRVTASTKTMGSVSSSATWFNRGMDGCRVPLLSNSTLGGNAWPSDQNSPSPGARVTLRIVAEHSTTSPKTKPLEYQWYRGVSGDRRSKVTGGTTDEISVSPQQTAYYWVEVTDPDCGANQSRTAEIFVSDPPRRRRRAVGHDFNLDGMNDIPWHNTVTGATEIWAMNGIQRIQTLPVGTNPAQLQSTGDLNGDERPDLLWRDPATGRNDVWLMNRWNVGWTEQLESRSGGNWSIGAVADFDDDNHHDVVWHNSATGANEIWFQDGTDHAGSWALPATPSGQWGLHGTGDFNGDEKPDLFFHDRATGANSVWLMNDAARASVQSNGAASTAAKRTLRVQTLAVASMPDTNNVPMLVTDMNGDGKPDIVWRNVVTGDNSVWLMNGTAQTSTVALEPRTDLDWQIGGGGTPGGGGGGSDERTATAITVSATPAAHNSAAIVTATLVANGTGVANRTLVFTLNGSLVARLVTDENGSAVAAASVIGIAPGTYPNALAVRFDGTELLLPSQAAADLIIERPLPVVTWNAPAAVTYGTALSSAQLNATADMQGTFVYSPPAGTILDAGFNALEVTFTPADTAFAPVKKTVVLEVTPAAATIFWQTPAPIAYGTPLSQAQLRAATGIPGTFTYNPPSGTLLGIGTHTLQVTFMPSEEGNYTPASASVSLTVIQGTQTISWASPAPITYGTPLSVTQLNATVAKSGSAPAGAVTYSPAAGTVLPAGTHTLTVTAAATSFYAAASKSVTLTVNRATPVLSWSAPATIVYGTPLSNTQLNATANVAGTFTWSPAAGTTLNTGTHTLTAQFTPADAANYNGASASVQLTVIKATPVLSWSAPAGITYGTALSGTQLNATSDVAGSFTYSPAAGTVLNAGTHTLSAQFTPADPANYNSGSITTSVSVAKALQTLSWVPPAPIVYGTPLSAAQLNATVSVVGPSPAGALTYSPAAGTVLHAGPAQTLTVSAAATPNYEPATLFVTIDVLKAKPVLAWATPAPIVYRTALSAAQLNATANVPGSFTYSPSSGTVLEAGMRPLSAHFTPTDTRNYEEADAGVTLEVQQATPVITWLRPAGIVYGTALSATQLNATADVPGAFTYTPPAGTILDAGDGQTLRVDFVPADTRNFRNVSASGTIDVAKAPQTLSWAAPAPIVYGTRLTSAQLNAQVSVVGPAAAGALVYSPAAGTVLDAGSRTLTVTALETANYLSATMSVSLEVNRAPLSLVVHAKSKLYGAPVPPLTGTMTGVQNSDPIAPSYATTGTMQSNTGTYPITATLLDPAGRLFNYDVTITPSTLTVLPAPLQIAANPATSQYSDPLAQLGATFTGFVLGETPSVLGGTLVITTTATPLSAPGTYPIAIGGLTSSNYAITFVPSTYTVTQEDARVTITSPLFVTAPASKPGTLTLSATVKDVSATADAAGDVHAGDIRKATLAFVDRATGAVLCTAPIGLFAADDARVGMATCTASGTFPPSLTVGADVAGWYARNDTADDVVLSLSAPTADSVTGSGNITIAGAPAKLNLNLKYDKTGVAKGNFTVAFQRTVDGVVRRYELSATTVDSLHIRRGTTGGTATITGTAVLRDVTTTTPVVLDAAASLIATAADNGEPSAADTVSIALLRKDGGSWLTVDWNGERTVPQAVTGGNVQIHQAK